ncbi:MAG: hypothetical protein EOP84_28510 [Verrucomicrobiaceae bacterium]|nr:MAG: hypothetical protein EOP84_28510 [Verrucomicrobiaceae bacterium]
MAGRVALHPRDVTHLFRDWREPVADWHFRHSRRGREDRHKASTGGPFWRAAKGLPCLLKSSSSTASTAEMVAQAMHDYVGAKIFGSASAGQLLVGVWYPVPELGTGVKISVPEAVYQTRRGHKIEGPGVQIDKVLYYHLEELQNGEDSWIKAAIGMF